MIPILPIIIIVIIIIIIITIIIITIIVIIIVFSSSITSCLRPVHLLRVSLLRVLESNFPGDSL